MMAARFGAASTAEDALASIDLHGYRILVTGVSAGMGVETARVLVAHGASVVGTASDLEKARAATAQIHAQTTNGEALQLIELDLASLASVRRCSDRLLSAGEPFDLVIGNAGVMAGPKRTTIDGFETQFGTNHLGHFVLINRIASLLKTGGRIVMVSSAAHRRADVDLQDPNFKRSPYDELIAYGRSKTAIILFAVEFDRRHKSAGIRATAVHPGAVLTETVQKMIGALGDERDAVVAAYNWKTVPQGAATAVWAGVVSAPNDVGARYCEDCNIAEVVVDPKSRVGVRSYALNSENAEALWATSEALVREHF